LPFFSLIYFNFKKKKKECATGSYKDDIGDDGSCTPCPDYSNTSGPASISADDCVCIAGYGFSGENCEGILSFFLLFETKKNNTTTISLLKLECAQNYFKDSTGNDECTECPAHSTTSGSTGSTSEDECICDSGYIKVGGICVCDVGYELNGANCQSILFFSFFPFLIHFNFKKKRMCNWIL